MEERERELPNSVASSVSLETPLIMEMPKSAIRMLLLLSRRMLSAFMSLLVIYRHFNHLWIMPFPWT